MSMDDYGNAPTVRDTEYTYPPEKWLRPGDPIVSAADERHDALARRVALLESEVRMLDRILSVLITEGAISE